MDILIFGLVLSKYKMVSSSYQASAQCICHATATQGNVVNVKIDANVSILYVLILNIYNLYTTGQILAG